MSIDSDRRVLRPRLEDRLADEARFIKTWFDNPVLTGAVSPSGRFLARMMARAVDPQGRGPIVELGPGTGPITQALLSRGVDPLRLLLVEFDSAFCRLLRKRFPNVQVVQADAYALRQSLKGALAAPAASIVSSLPLLNKPDAQRLALLDDAFALMAPGGVVRAVHLRHEFTDAARRRVRFRRRGLPPPIWLNLPPARVWIYRRKTELDTPDFGRSSDLVEMAMRGAGSDVFRPAKFRPVTGRTAHEGREMLFRRKPRPAAVACRD